MNNLIRYRARTAGVAIRILLSFLIAMSMIAGSAGMMPAYAEPKAKTDTIRVGWWESEFNHQDDNGWRTGYAYEYQQKIASYTGWNYEYVEGDWYDLLDKLKSGEIDLLADVSKTDERADEMLFSAQPMGEEEYVLLVSADSETIIPSDISTLNGKKIGVAAGGVAEGIFRSWAASNDIHAEIVELEQSQGEQAKLLRNGEIDALVDYSGFEEYLDGCVPIISVGTQDFYFAINKNKPELKKEIDSAMNMIFTQNRGYNHSLDEKYISNSTANKYLSAGEVEWLKEHGPIRIGYKEDYFPYSGTENGEVAGLVKDLIRKWSGVMSNADIEFEAVPYPSTEAAVEAVQQGEVDLAFPVFYDDYDAERKDILISDTVAESKMDAVIRKSDLHTFNTKDAVRVACLTGDTSQETIVRGSYPQWKYQTYDTVEECFDAIEKGKADYFIICDYRVSLLNGDMDKHDLTSVGIETKAVISFAMNKDEMMLYSIINKLVPTLDRLNVTASLREYSARNRAVGVGEFIKEHLLGVGILFAVIFTLFGYFLVRIINEGRKRKLHEIEEKRLGAVYDMIEAARWQFEVDSKGKPCNLIWNDKLSSILGYDGCEDELSLGEWTSSIVEGDRERVIQGVRALITSDDTEFDEEYRLVTRQGEVRWIHAMARKVQNSGIEVIGTCVDITAQKKAEWQTKVNMTLADEYSSVFEVDLDDETLIRHKVSGRLQAMDNDRFVDPSYAVRCDAFIELAVSPADQEMMRKAISIENIRRMFEETDSFSTIYLNKMGQYCELKITRIDESRMVMGIAEKDEDVRREMRQTESLRRALERAEAANRAKSTFLFNMSHDIRTPMNAIKGFTELAEQNIEDHEKAQDYIHKVMMASNQLTDILNNVLEMARIENNKVVIERELEDAEEVFTATVAVFEGELKKKGLAMETSCEMQHRWLYMDKTHLAEVLMNVMSNAIKYTPAGGRIYAGNRELPGEHEDECIIETTIQDTGIGMSDEFVAQIFEEFSRERTSSSSGIQGTGLGMAIVKNLVELMDGTITINSNVGEGTEIILRIPYRIGEEPAAAKSEAADLQRDILQGKRILVAEDIDVNAILIQEILKMNGMGSDRAKDGVECVSMLQNAEDGYYDLVLMDIQMPNMNGYEATRQIRCIDDEQKAHIPIVALSANAFQEDVMRSLQAGMNGHLAKPIDVDLLTDKLSELMSNREKLSLEDLLLANDISIDEITDSDLGIYCTDESRRIIFWNEGAAKITGYTEEQIKGKHCFYSGLKHQDEEGNQLCVNSCPVLDSILGGGERAVRISALCSDGDRRWLKVTTKPLMVNGRTYGAIEYFSLA